ncbi:helix-turn-helix domain-containing protein [Dehalococcoidales bacterium]|nr:helix-turn-helix domain-containing protein [Dehalococcoidales bacterium]
MESKIFQSFWTVIPTVIFEDERVPLRAKKLYGLISSLTQKEGYCWASNNFLAEKSKIPLGTVRRYLKLLKKLNYIDCEINEEGNQRKIWITALVEKVVENSGKVEKKKEGMFTVIRTHEQGGCSHFR